MKRDIDMKEISDGNLYELNDLVKADCGDCKGCFSCCQGMGKSIILDPLDIYHLTMGLGITFEELLANAIELNVVDGVILPNLKMTEPDSQCYFLDNNGRCSIHNIRPGICRLFPLGRIYEENSFKYFLQIHECKHPNKTKVKVKKWIDIPDIQKNQEFIMKWHNFIVNSQKHIAKHKNDDLLKKIDMFVLQHFFMERYRTDEDFYSQFDTRLEKANVVIKTLLKTYGERE